MAARDGSVPVVIYDRYRSSDYFAPGHIAGDVEELDLVDRLEVRVVVELPDDFLFARHFDDLRLFADVAVAEIDAEDGVAVRETLCAGHEAERIAGEIVFIQFPHDLFLRVEFDDFVAVAAGDEEVAIGQRVCAVRVAGDFDRT